MFNVGIIAASRRSAPLLPVEWVGARGGRGVTSGSSVSVTVPTEAINGDFLVAVMAAPGVIDYNMSLTSSGWDKRVDVHTLDASGQNGVNLAIFTKIKTAADTSVACNAQITGADTYLTVSAFRNVSTTNPLDVSIATSYDMYNSTVNTASITPVTTGAMIFGGGMGSSFFTSGGISTSLTAGGHGGWVDAYGAQRNTTAQANGNVSGYAIGYKANQTAGTNSPTVFFNTAYTTGNYRCNISFAMALRPA